MGKIIFIDVDGTLVNYEGVIPASAIEAIRQARKNGHRVYMCTGRSRAEIYQDIWNIGLDGLIGGNGSYIEDNNKVVFHKTLTLKECIEVVDWLKSRNLEFYLECNGGLFGSEKFREVADPVMKEYRHRKGKADYKTFGVKKAFPEMIFNENLYRDDVNKISFILNSYQDHLDSKEEFFYLEANTWGGAGEIALFGDLGVKNIDKANAIKILLEYLKAKREDTLAIGDAKIDVSMLKYCEVGVAVGNAGSEAKEAADYVTDSIYNDGIYKAFKKFNLI